MPRSGTTQTRQFIYNTLGQLQSAVNPENGTTTLAYNTDGSLFSKTEEGGQTHLQALRVVKTCTSNCSAPGVVTLNSSTNLASSFTYTSFLRISTATAKTP